MELHVRIFVTSMVILAGTFCVVGDTDVVDGILELSHLLVLFLFFKKKIMRCFLLREGVRKPKEKYPQK